MQSFKVLINSGKALWLCILKRDSSFWDCFMTSVTESPDMRAACTAYGLVDIVVNIKNNTKSRVRRQRWMTVSHQWCVMSSGMVHQMDPGHHHWTRNEMDVWSIDYQFHCIRQISEWFNVFINGRTNHQTCHPDMWQLIIVINSKNTTGHSRR